MDHRTTTTTAGLTIDPDALLAGAPAVEQHTSSDMLEHDPRAGAHAWLTRQLRWEDRLSQLRSNAVQFGWGTRPQAQTDRAPELNSPES
jgi:hypothetical protein